MSGPYDSERQAAADVRHIYDSPPGTGAWGDGNHRLIEDACTAAGVQLGAYDHRILLWLAGWEPSTCAVIAGLITRAHAAGAATVAPAGNADLTPAQVATVLKALGDAIGVRDDRGHRSCQACEEHPARLCDDTAADLDALEEYQALEQALTGPAATAGTAAPGVLRGWELTLRQAIVDAIRWREARAGRHDTEQVGMYRWLASDLGIEVPE